MIGLIIPPGDIKKLVEKTAEHVAHNGQQFQKILIEREQHKSQFTFLQKDSPYRAYYDHKVGEFSKKMIESISVEIEKKDIVAQPSIQIQIKQIENINSKPEPTQQETFLEKIFIELKQPDPQKYVAQLPEKISEGQMAIIQHTAQYVAKNGKNFLIALSERQKNNPQFQFLKPSSANNHYFSHLVDGYTNILNGHTQQLINLLRSYQNKEEIFKKCKVAFEYYSAKLQQTKGKKEQQAKQTKENNIDWNDFELVETITFEDHNNQFKNNELIAKIQQHASMIPKTLEEKIISEPKKREILQQCHACRQNILASQMNKHLKTCLAQKKPKDNKQQSLIGDDVDIRRNLESLSIKRPDIFGSQQNHITLRQQQQLKDQPKVIYDGQGANMTRATGGMAMVHFQQRKLKQQQQKEQK